MTTVIWLVWFVGAALIAYIVLRSIRGRSLDTASECTGPEVPAQPASLEGERPAAARVDSYPHITYRRDELQYIAVFDGTEARTLRSADVYRFGEGAVRFSCRWENCDGPRKPGRLFCDDHPATAAVAG